MTRTMDQMRALCLELSEVVSEQMDAHVNLGAVVILYQPEDIDSSENSPVMFAASRTGDVPKVLANLLEQHFLKKPEKGNGST